MIQDITIPLPPWLKTLTPPSAFSNDTNKMEFAIFLAKKNIKEKTGGPFGAAIFSSKTNKLLAYGVNLVTYANISILHAEIVTFILAQKKLKSYTLNFDNEEFELFSSSEPCAMCLGACLWSGVKKVVYGAPAKYAREIGFDEGPVFPESWQYLQQKGIQLKTNVLADKARKVLLEYKNKQGIIYNG